MGSLYIEAQGYVPVLFSGEVRKGWGKRGRGMDRGKRGRRRRRGEKRGGEPGKGEMTSNPSGVCMEHLSTYLPSPVV